MPDLIQNSRLDFAQLRSDAAEAAVLARRLAGELTDDSQARSLLRAFLGRAQTVAQTMVEHPNFKEYEYVRSEDWNTFQEQLQIDLRTIYDAMAALEAASKQMEVVAQADLTQTKAAILKAISQLEVYEFLRENPEYQDLKTIDFIRSINETDRRPLAVVDNDIRMLELPPKSRQVASSSRLDGRRTRVSTKVFGPGKLTGFGEQFAPKNIVDPNRNNFWVEVMSTKAPVQQTHNCSWGQYIAHGVVAEITIDFSHVERINNLKMLPFSEYPYNIIDVAYRESSASNKWLTLPEFSIKESVEDWVEFDFTYIAVDQLRITIEQPNYVRNVSLVPTSLVRKNSLWAQLKTDDLVKDIHEIDLTSREEGKVAVEPEQLRHLVALERLDKVLEQTTFIGERHTEYEDYTRYVDAISNVVDEVSPGAGDEVREPTRGERKLAEDPTQTVVTYDYLLGIRVFMLSTITYQPLAYYESPEFTTNGTVVQVQLDTDEMHPTFFESDGVLSYRRTSIEYEVETSPDTRFPIVPISSLEGANYIVRDEWVRLTRGKGRLRFSPASPGVTVRKNGTRISLQDVTVADRDIFIANADKNAIYTVTYQVEEDATYVNVDEVLDSTKLLTPEEFQGTDSENKVVLKYYPYISYEIVRNNQLWVKNDDDALWEWNPDFFPLSVGSIALSPGSTAITLTKDSGSDPGFLTLASNGSFPVNSEMKIWVQETNEILEVDTNPPAAITDTLAYLTNLYEGDVVSSSRFILGRTVTHDNVTYGLNIDTYEPIKVLVNGVKALNKTDYYARQNPSFSPTNVGTEKQYEYIQAGKVLYFNGPVEGKISVVYNWLTQYLKLVSTLRCHVPVATIFTPKIDRAKMRVKTTEL